MYKRQTLSIFFDHFDKDNFLFTNTNGELMEPIKPIFFRTSICLLGHPSSNNSKIIKLLSKSIIVSPFFSNSNKILITSFTKFPYFFSLNLKIPKIKLNI